MGEHSITLARHTILFNGDAEVLLLKRRGLGLWILPGGRIDHDKETPSQKATGLSGEVVWEFTLNRHHLIAALRRELNEEIGATPEVFNWLQSRSHLPVGVAEWSRYKSKDGSQDLRVDFIDCIYLGNKNTLPVHIPKDSEISAFTWTDAFNPIVPYGRIPDNVLISLRRFREVVTGRMPPNMNFFSAKDYFVGNNPDEVWYSFARRCDGQLPLREGFELPKAQD